MSDVAALESHKAPVIRPTQVFVTETLRATLRLPAHGTGREVRLGRLRASKRAGRYWFLGAWVLQWPESGEVGGTRQWYGRARVANVGTPRRTRVGYCTGGVGLFV